MKKRPLIFFAGFAIVMGIVLAIPDVLAASDPFSEIEARGNEFLDFLLGPVSKIAAGLFIFGYLIKFMITKKFEIAEASIYGICAICLALARDIVDFFFQS
ncbi:MAG: hypothetical protein DI628_00525 [Blastochloris viridis]|uniref:TrbC/VIRB2 family protein n=1 Tax=Blastochloris viridis TaxID=1079 RepID=A0A6N4RDD6_BLAVI|nr:MAG: hypothetical protein DI628_00525 [Blastochloris viridis]